MTKADVVAAISEKTGLDKTDVLTTVEVFFNSIKGLMAEGENIYMRGFGSFVNKKRARKVAGHITRNTSMLLEEHFIPSFKPAKIFVEKVKKSPKLNNA